MELARLVALVAGIAIVVLTVWSVFTALVVPRATSSRLLGTLARTMSASARRLTPRLPNFAARDRLLSFVGPAAVVSQFVLWLCLILLGLALIIWWNSGVDFPAAVGIAGSSVFTLGIATAPGRRPAHARDRCRRPRLRGHRAGDRLPAGAVQRVRHPGDGGDPARRPAGTPAWGPEILARHFWLDTMDELPPLYADWERWASAVSESHANYPGLLWFRSPVSSRSWLIALVAMMDSAAMYHSVSPARTPRQARLCLSMGIGCMRSMARALRIPYETDPLPTTGIRLTKAEFEDGFRRLEEVHFPAERDLDESWRNFQGWRVNYEPIVDALTRLIAPPPAPWFAARPELGDAEWPIIVNRTPDEPQGAQGFGVSKIFKTPSARESNNS